MSKKMKEIAGIIIMVVLTVIIAFIIAGFTLNLEENQYYKIQTEELSNKDFLLVKILNYNTNSPLANVTITVLEHGEGRLLSGPYRTNESGYAIIQIPLGYKEHFDIVGDYMNVINTITIDKRSSLVKSEAYLGTLGVGIIVAIITTIVGIIAGMLIERRRAKRKG
jgi:ABC-type dipeptide/oligopeptide/nickel transport system permease component